MKLFVSLRWDGDSGRGGGVKFFYRFKGGRDQKSLRTTGLYQNPPTFFFTNPRFVLLIRDRRFDLFSLHRAYAFVTNAYATHTS